MIQGYQQGLRRVPFQEGRIQADRSALLRHEHQSAVTDGKTSRTGTSSATGPASASAQVRLHHHPRERARMVRQQHLGGRRLGHVDPRGLDDVSRRGLCRALFGYDDALKYVNGYKRKVANKAPIITARGIHRIPTRISPSRARSSCTHCARRGRPGHARPRPGSRLVEADARHLPGVRVQNIMTEDLVRFVNKETGRNWTPILQPAPLVCRSPDAGADVQRDRQDGVESLESGREGLRDADPRGQAGAWQTNSSRRPSGRRCRRL